MNFEPSDDQASVLAGLDSLLAAYRDAPHEAVHHVYSESLRSDLEDGGYLDVATMDGFGPLDAALIIERVARLPVVTELAASALIKPILPTAISAGPLALAYGGAQHPIRYLPVARTLLVVEGDDVSVMDLPPGAVKPEDSLLAYPYGKLLPQGKEAASAPAHLAAVRRRWQIGLACEAAGCMAAALELVVEHVKNRVAFRRPLGSFQAIQHRLAMAAKVVEATKWLAFRAAWSDADADAAIAAGYSQNHVAQFTYDLHQFTGAMGLTLEFPLHLWTYRLRALCGELGGGRAQALEAASAVWGDRAA